MRGRHAWLPMSEAERESVRDELGLGGVPTMVLLGPDGRILDSSPHVSADNLEARLHHWQALLGSQPESDANVQPATTATDRQRGQQQR